MENNIVFDTSLPARVMNVGYETVDVDGLSVGVKLTSYNRRTAEPPFRWVLSHIQADVISPSIFGGLGFEWIDKGDAGERLLHDIILEDLARKGLTAASVRDQIDENYLDL